jgi:hypothetical protein
MFLLLLLLLLVSCTKPLSQDAPPPVPPPDGISAPTIAAKPWAIVEAGENPLWFEVDSGGPRLIDSPGNASLTPFKPWPLARNITGMQSREGRLIMAVNRDGFLLWVPGPGEGLSLFHLPGGGWDPYNHASLFLFHGEWAVLLYRDDFFIESGAALPSPRVWGISPEHPAPVPVDIPAFAALPPEEGWDLDMLRLGRDGFWYYRGVKKTGPEPEIRYLRTPDLNLLGQKSSPGVFRNATVPYTTEEAPPLLRQVLDGAFLLGGPGQAQVAAVASPDFPAVRYYTTGVAQGDSLVELAGYLEDRGPAGSFALAILPDGRGVWGAAPAETAEPSENGPYRVEPFSLPPLPEGFVYTRIGMAGSAVAAAWEEQQSWQVGAAGFLIMRGIPF